MTIQEAIKSGKPFKRTKWIGWYFVDGERLFGMDGNSNKTIVSHLFISEILSNDWEIKEEEMRKPLTEKTDSRILFSRIRDIALRRPYQSRMYTGWLKENWPSGDLHHACGSAGSLKSSNLLAVIVPRKEHTEGEESIEWLMEQIPQAVLNLMDYVMFLEQRIREMRME